MPAFIFSSNESFKVHPYNKNKMKALELFFDNQNEDSIYESWCFESEPHQEALGNLYIIAKLKGKDETSLDVLASSISNAYSAEGSLESAINIANKKIKERGLTNLELVIIAIKDKGASFTKTDGTKVALLRDEEVINIGNKLKGNLANIGTVKLNPKDKILAITSKAWRKSRQKHLISKITAHNKESKIRDGLSDLDVPGVALMIIMQSELLRKIKGKTKALIKRSKGLSLIPTKKIKKYSSKIPTISKDSPLKRRVNKAWPERKAQETPFLIALSYLLTFIGIRLLVTLAGSVNSPIAQSVKESSSITHFHIGRNIILFGYHIHHFYFGILLIAIAGWLSVTDSSKIGKKGLAITYGIGLGLLMDEIGLLLTWGNYTSSLSYLLGVLLLGILLNIIYFPSFWKRTRNKVVKKKFGLSGVNKIFKIIIRVADKASGKE